jgi:hypothetical protein
MQEGFGRVEVAVRGTGAVLVGADTATCDKQGQWCSQFIQLELHQNTELETRPTEDITT